MDKDLRKYWMIEVFRNHGQMTVMKLTEVMINPILNVIVAKKRSKKEKVHKPEYKFHYKGYKIYSAAYGVSIGVTHVDSRRI